jgi:ElaB/YqjD/DUF883 family membrane-anchored ribosome-binding protein
MTETTQSGAAPPREGSKKADTSAKRAEAVKARAEQVRTWAQTQGGVAKEWAAERAGQVKTLINQEPVMAVTISTAAAFVAGAVLGLVIGRLTAD